MGSDSELFSRVLHEPFSAGLNLHASFYSINGHSCPSDDTEGAQNEHSLRFDFTGNKRFRVTLQRFDFITDDKHRKLNEPFLFCTDNCRGRNT